MTVLIISLDWCIGKGQQTEARVKCSYLDVNVPIWQAPSKLIKNQRIQQFSPRWNPFTGGRRLPFMAHTIQGSLWGLITLDQLEIKLVFALVSSQGRAKKRFIKLHHFLSSSISITFCHQELVVLWFSSVDPSLRAAWASLSLPNAKRAAACKYDAICQMGDITWACTASLRASCGISLMR